MIHHQNAKMFLICMVHSSWLNSYIYCWKRWKAQLPLRQNCAKKEMMLFFWVCSSPINDDENIHYGGWCIYLHYCLHTRRREQVRLARHPGRRLILSSRTVQPVISTMYPESWRWCTQRAGYGVPFHQNGVKIKREVPLPYVVRFLHYLLSIQLLVDVPELRVNRFNPPD